MRTGPVLRRRYRLALGVVLAWLCGCAVITHSVHEQAASELGCPHDAVSVQSLGDGRYRAAGCGRVAAYHCARDRVGHVRCGRSGGPLPEDQRAARVQAKAARSLRCDTEAVTVERQGPGGYTARGCGRLVDYECLSRPDCCLYEQRGNRPPRASDGAPSGDGKADDAEATAEQGGIPKREVQRIIVSSDREVRACYERILTAPPYPAGKVSVKFIIEADGNVSKIAVSGSSLHDSEVESCIANVVGELAFPPPAGGGIVVVNFPFVLTTTPGPYKSCR